MSRRVLVVDDDTATAEMLEMVLSEQGHSVRVLHDPTRVLAALAQWPPDVVLLDVMMPGRNGFEVLAQVRHAHPGLAVWLMSAHLAGQLDASLLLGAAGFIQKPFVWEDLLAAVEG